MPQGVRVPHANQAMQQAEDARGGRSVFDSGWQKALQVLGDLVSGGGQPEVADAVMPMAGMAAKVGRRAASPALEFLDPYVSRVNASGESGASLEAINRLRGMKGKGQQHVVYDRAGRRRPLIGPDAVDYRVRQGESYGIEGPDGFRLLDDMGGRPPTPLGGPRRGGR